MASKTAVEVFTDGACRGNPGPGGWCAILRHGASEKVLTGAERATTNNRMELRGPLEALRSLKHACRVEVTSDSQYLVRGMTEWLAGWVRRGWRRAGNKRVENEDLWRALQAAADGHEVAWRWIRGHAGHVENERCDRLANEAIDRMLAGGRGG